LFTKIKGGYAMIIAFPVETNQGLDSRVFGHFGTAAGFVLVDENSGTVETHTNADRNHPHGQCRPLAALGDHKVDAIVVGGIGGGALHKLLNAGIRVFRAVDGTVRENLELIRSERLPAFTMTMTCGGNGAPGGCAHH
jgi:predicted Fe-Mo cluster-binding NifX family protein